MGLHGLLPPAVFTQEQQEVRVLANLRRWAKDIDKYIYLMGLQDRNEKLFFKVCLIPIMPSLTTSTAYFLWERMFPVFDKIILGFGPGFGNNETKNKGKIDVLLYIVHSNKRKKTMF